MTKILALVDGSGYAQSVCHHAAWIAQRLGAAVDLLHLLPEGGAAGSKDLSGALALGARTALLADLAELDAQRAKLTTAQGHAILGAARAIVEADGAGPVTEKLRYGDLVETLARLQPDVRALVMGKRGEGSAGAFEHLGHNLERVLRSATVPVFVASRQFQPIARVLIAFDASASALRAVDRMAASPVFAGLETVLVHVGPDTPAIRHALASAQAKLEAGGLQSSARVVAGEPEAVLDAMVTAEGFGLLVMGAYGHSRIRNLIIGSTTTALIRACKIPVLLYR